MDNGNSELYDRSPHSKNSEEEGEEVGYEYDEKSFDDEEEEEEEEDEEEARKVAEGFIVDDDEEQESDASQEVAVRRKKRKKVQDFDEELDEEDLDLLEENTGLKLSRSSAPKLKRLKRGRQEEEPTARAERAVDKFFSDEEEEAAAVEDQMEEDDDRYRGRGGYVQQYDDLNDFIAEEDEDERYEDERGMDYARPAAPRGRLTKDMMDILPQGLTEDAIADMYDIFGDGADYEWALYDEEGEEVEQERELQLADVFEPSELAERMLTDQDEDIRMMDVPERMQLRYSGIEKDFLTKPSTEEVENEAMWIARELTRIKPEYQLGDTFVSAVRSVVGFMTRNLLEVPFIYDQRKDYIVEIDPVTGVTNEILTYDDLWKIYDLDFRYDGLVRRKHLLREFMSKCFISDADIDQLLESAEKTEEVADLQDHITFQYAENVHRAQKQTKGPKRPTSKLNYESALKKRLQGFLERFSITARQLGMNYYENGRRYYPDDTLISPEEAANEYKDEHALTTPELVLKAAKSVLALEIANDPLVRKAMRRDWETRAVVTVKPTDKGYDIIDDLHPLHPYKFLYQKPIQTFRNGAFLHILKGESDGLLQISITIANYDGWFKQIAEFYMSDGYSDSAQQWNAQRKQVLEIAMNEHLRPLMEKHIREKLRQSAQEEICEGAYKNLLAKVDVGPFRGPGADTYKNGIPRVVTVSFGNGGRDDPVNGVCLNHRSRIIDKIQLPNLRDSSYIKDMTDFLTTTRPHVVGVAGYTAETRRLLKTMQQLVADINNDSSYEGPTIDVLTVDDDTARLYKNSKRAENEFGELPEVMRYCISLARKLQCPVLEYTSLGRDLLAISHHDLQRLVPSDVLLVYLERALVKVVNDMGIDINAAARSPYLGSAAQYICGLGPRKAHSLLKKIDVKGELESRSALITRGLTAAHIFMNCASYIRIRNIEDADILDDTRIHPQEYELAQKMAGDALEIDEDEMEDPDAKAAIVRRVVQEYPEKLNDLILDDYAVVLKEQYNEPKRQVLEHIKLELQNPFYEKRRRFVRPTIEEQFMMVTGETPQTLREGFIIPVKIVALRGKVANCVLDSGLEGFIYADNAADGRVMNVADVLKRGATINAKVLHIDRDKFTVDLSCRPSDTKPDSDVKLRKLPDDQYYDYEGEAKEIERRHAMERKRVKEKRMINHPLFRPFNYIQAEEYLATKNRGDIVLRPSSRGPDHIALTWKLDDGLYHHVDIVEEKVGNQIYYKIGDQRYSDLDQLSVLYVEAVHQRTEELMLHPKFRQGGPAALKSHLQSLTMANPKMSAYGFCVSDRPGYFELGFKLNAKASYANYFIKIGPKGYRFGETMYPDIPELINGFKRFQVGQSRKSSRNPSRR